jgi:hypothetical protein
MTSGPAGEDSAPPSEPRDQSNQFDVPLWEQSTIVLLFALTAFCVAAGVLLGAPVLALPTGFFGGLTWVIFPSLWENFRQYMNSNQQHFL